MATYYLVATGNINVSAPFSSTTGGAGGAGTPTTGDTIICDGNSQTGGVPNTLTINVAISLAMLDCDHGGAPGPFIGTLSHSNVGLTIVNGTAAGTLRFSSGMNYTNTGTVGSLVQFTHASGTAQLTSGGQKFAAITANCPGGTVQPQDNLQINGCTNAVLTITAGTWDNAGAGGGSLTLTACSINSNNSNTRTVSLGGLVKLGGNVAQSTSLWNFTTTTNLTFNKNSANIEVLASSTPFNGLFFTPGTTNPTAFNTLTFDALTSPCMLSWSGGNTTIATLVVNPGWSITFASAGAVTVQNPFNWVGTPTLPIGLTTLGPVNATINCGSAALSTLKWGVIGGVNGGGAGATFRADNSLAVGQTNWSVFQPIDAALLPAQVATAVWQDLLSSSDFSTSASVGALVKAMSNLQFTVPAMARGTVGASSSVTSVVTSALDPPGAALDQFKNGVVVFDKATTTAALRGQRGLISGSSNVAAPILTVAAPGLTTAPVSGDTFTVV